MALSAGREKILGILVAIVLFSLTTLVWAVTSPQQIRALVKQEVKRELQRQNIIDRKGQRVDFEVSQIDSRLRLSECNQAIAVDLGNSELLGRVTAKVQCLGSSPWSIYVPFTVRVYKKVITLREPASSGKVIQRHDLQLMEKEVSTLTQGYFTGFSKVTGKQLKRSVRMNGVVTPRILTQPKVIKKGDEVMIVAAKGSLSVSSPGIALADGRIGQQINVKNRSSKKIIRARVKQKGLVEVVI